jgi:hypothetical protein
MNEDTPQRDWLKELRATIENIDSLKASLEEQLDCIQATVKELKAECEFATKAIRQMKLVGAKPVQRVSPDRVPEDSSKGLKEKQP